MQKLELISLAVVYSAWVALLLWLITGGPQRRIR